MDSEKRFGHPDGLAVLTFQEQRAVLTEWGSKVNEIHDIATVTNAVAIAKDAGLHAVAKLAEEWPDASDWLMDCFEHARYELVVRRAFGERPELRPFEGFNHEFLH